MHRRCRFIPIALLVMTIPLAAVGAFLWLGNVVIRDEPRPDDRSLVLTDVNVADGDNAFVDFQKIEMSGSYLNEPAEKLSESVRGQNWDEPYVVSTIARHQTDIQQFHSAVAKPSWQDPTFARPSAVNLNTGLSSNFSSYRPAAQTVALEAEYRARNGDVPGALTEALEVVRLGHLIESGQGPLIQYLVGSSIKQIGLTALRQIALNSSIAATQSLDTAQKLEPYLDSRPGQVAAMKMEYLAFSQSVPKYVRLGQIFAAYNLTTTIDGSIPEQPTSLFFDILDYSGLTRYYYLPHQTWRFAVEEAEDRVNSAQADCTAVNVNPPRRFQRFEPRLGMIFTPNAVGKMLVSIGEVSYGAVSTKRCNESLAVSATQATLATSAFIKETGHEPSSLSELVPQYLGAVPKDPYNGNALLYVADKKLVYSVGPDRKDLGGDPVSSDWVNQKNPSFSVNK